MNSNRRPRNSRNEYKCFGCLSLESSWVLLGFFGALSNLVYFHQCIFPTYPYGKFVRKLIQSQFQILTDGEIEIGEWNIAKSERIITDLFLFPVLKSLHWIFIILTILNILTNNLLLAGITTVTLKYSNLPTK